jgi:hypothetical protein
MWDGKSSIPPSFPEMGLPWKKVMEKFLTGVKRKPSNKPVPCSSQPGISKPKSQKYDESYLSFSFTSVVKMEKNDLSVSCVLVS